MYDLTYTCFKVYFPIFGVQQVLNCVPSNAQQWSYRRVFLGSLFTAGTMQPYNPADFGIHPISLKQVVSPLKDVEGLHFKFHYNLYHKCVPSCSFMLTLTKKLASVLSNQNPCWRQLCQLLSQRTPKSRRMARSSPLFPVLLSQSLNV